MPWFLGVAVYLLVWWVTLFAILPIGIRTQDDDGVVEAGTHSSAPSQPRILLKVGLTTLISTAIFGAFYVALASGYIGLEDIPFLPHYQNQAH